MEQVDLLKFNSNFGKRHGRFSDLLFVGRVPRNHTFLEVEEQ
jgi:hypothetical protein